MIEGKVHFTCSALNIIIILHRQEKGMYDILEKYNSKSTITFTNTKILHLKSMMKWRRPVK